MDHRQRLTVLKAHKLDLSGGPVFDNHSHCVDWVNRVAPMLKYDDEHYQEFMHYAQVMIPEQISVDLRMTHIRALAGIVDRAVIELENNIEKNQHGDDSNQKPPTKSEPVEPRWHKTTFGKIGLAVAIAIAVALALFLIKHFLGIDLKS